MDGSKKLRFMRASERCDLLLAGSGDRSHADGKSGILFRRWSNREQGPLPRRCRTPFQRRTLRNGAMKTAIPSGGKSKTEL